MLQDATEPDHQVSRRYELRHDLQPIGKEAQRERCAAEKEHRHVKRLNENETFLR